MCPNAQVGCKAGNQALLRDTVEGLPHLTHLGLIARTNTVYHNHDDCIVPRCTEVSAGWAHPGHTLCRAAESFGLGQTRTPAHGRICSPRPKCRSMGTMLAPLTGCLPCHAISAVGMLLLSGAAATRRCAGARQAGGADCHVRLAGPRCCAPQACTAPAPLLVSYLPSVRACRSRTHMLRGWRSRRPVSRCRNAGSAWQRPTCGAAGTLSAA